MQTSAEVDAWFDDLEHQLKDALLRAREVILEANPLSAHGAR